MLNINCIFKYNNYDLTWEYSSRNHESSLDICYQILPNIKCNLYLTHTVSFKKLKYQKKFEIGKILHRNWMGNLQFNKKQNWNQICS